MQTIAGLWSDAFSRSTASPPPSLATSPDPLVRLRPLTAPLHPAIATPPSSVKIHLDFYFPSELGLTFPTLGTPTTRMTLTGERFQADEEPTLSPLCPSLARSLARSLSLFSLSLT